MSQQKKYQHVKKKEREYRYGMGWAEDVWQVSEFTSRQLVTNHKRYGTLC